MVVPVFNLQSKTFMSYLQIQEVQVQVTQSTEALQSARTDVNELRRQIQTLEIELDSQKNLVGSLWISLCEWWLYVMDEKTRIFCLTHNCSNSLLNNGQ